jgi:hypothetical protein
MIIVYFLQKVNTFLRFSMNMEIKGKRSGKLPRSRHCDADESKRPTG